MRYIFYMADGSTLEIDSEMDYASVIADRKPEFISVVGDRNVMFNLNVSQIVRYLVLPPEVAAERDAALEAERQKVQQQQQPTEPVAPSETPTA